MTFDAHCTYVVPYEKEVAVFKWICACFSAMTQFNNCGLSKHFWTTLKLLKCSSKIALRVIHWKNLFDKKC